MSAYRLNYNGQQVSHTFDSYKEARRFYDAMGDKRATWIQWQDPDDGEWFTARQWKRDKAEGLVG